MSAKMRKPHRILKIEDGVAHVELAHGHVLLLDENDLDLVRQFRWYAVKGGRTYYVRRTCRATGKCRGVLLHRELIKPDSELVVDHANRNGLDNRRCNIRVATRSQNSTNSNHIKGLSAYRGIYFCKTKQKWCARIRVNKKRKSLGYFTDQIKAARAYDEAAKAYHGEFATLNHVSHDQKAAV